MAEVTQSVMNDTIRSLKTITYFYINERNASFSLSIIRYLQQLKIVGKLNSEINDLESDWKNIFYGSPLSDDSKKVFESLEEIKKMEKELIVTIPEKYNNSENNKLLYISTQTLVNMFCCGHYELAFQNLMEITLNWMDIYINVIGILKKDFNIESELGIWLMQHFLMIMDLLGTNNFVFIDNEINIKKIPKIKE